MIKCDHHILSPWFRLQDFRRTLPNVFEALQELGVNVACLGDLQGPKFRVGELLGEHPKGRVQYPRVILHGSKHKFPLVLPFNQSNESRVAFPDFIS